MLKVVIKDGSVINSNEEEGKRALRHTTSHILAQAVKRLYPNAKLAIGPAIDNGFYYDFDVEEPFTMEILGKIEEEMKKIVKEDLRLERSVISREDALKIMEEKGEPLAFRRGSFSTIFYLQQSRILLHHF